MHVCTENDRLPRIFGQPIDLYGESRYLGTHSIANFPYVFSIPKLPHVIRAACIEPYRFQIQLLPKGLLGFKVVHRNDIIGAVDLVTLR